MLVILLLFAVGSTTADRYYFISAPNVFHVGEPEKVSVLLTDIDSPATVHLHMQDYPHRKKTFSQVQAVFTKDKPGYLTVKVTPADLPDQGSRDKQYVYLVATCNHAQLTFKKEMKILLNFRNGIILVQTDKPIYTPKQTVNIRVIPLDFNLFPSKKKLTIIVKNPQGIRVQQWKNLNTDTGFISENLHLGDFILRGNWTIDAYFDGLVIYNTSTVFEVREYVLPKFSVEIKGPPQILPKQKKPTFYVTARTTYGRPVLGVASIRVKIVGFKQTPFAITSFRQLLKKDGVQFSITKQHIESLDRNIWFPEGCRLHIEASVTEKSTGITETAIENSILFTSSPYRITFTNTARYFKPGMQFPIKIQVTDTWKKPQANMPVKISSKGIKQDGSVVDMVQSALRTKDDAANKGRTNHDGYADFLVDVPRDIITLKIEAETNLPNFDNNGGKEYVINKYSSPSNEYLMVRQRKPVQVGQNVFCEAFVSSKTVERLHYMVIARGQIVHQNVYKEKIGLMKTIVFEATPVMSISSRLVAYYVLKNGEVISDTTTLDITDSFPNKISIKDPKDNEEYPGMEYKVEVFGEKGTRVGLLAVDQSVYLLRNENRLTPKSVFDKLEELDLGCGTGSGKDSKDVFKNSGLSVMTKSLVSDGRQDFTCQDAPQRRTKRGLGAKNAIDCCKIGETVDIKKGNCLKRVFDLDVPQYQFDKQARYQCKRQFFICCKNKFGLKGVGMLGRSAGNPPDLMFQDEEENLNAIQIRSFFPETWFFEERIIRDLASKKTCQTNFKRDVCHAASLSATVPHTITTWIVQAIAVSNTSGFGIAKPRHLTAFKNVFVSLTMPYSAQRGEQITILATVYNYGKKELKVHLRLYGNEGFCSIADPRSHKPTKITKKPLTIKGKDSISIPITIVPIKYGLVPVKVLINSNDFSALGDGVERNLLVIPEGAEKLKTQSFILDPQGVLKDSKQNGEKNDNDIKNSTFPWQQIFNKAQNKQIDNIVVAVPISSIPESVNAMISFTGNLIGPVVTNLITGGLEGLLRMPTGCGEQTMIYMSPNVYVLQYLSNTKQVTASVEAKAYRLIESGYKRELNYRRNDNSFSAFGNRRAGSTWLTAFVAKVFCEASKFDGVQIDENSMCMSIQWLIKNQRADGAFPEVHHVIHKEMVGGVYQDSDIPITAFVVTALQECKCHQVSNTAALTKAITYLEKNLDNMNDPYSIAITTYALAMANSPERHKANTKLTQLAHFDPAHVSRHWKAGGHALNIETAAYALLAQLALNRLKYAGPIVTWLTEQKNSGGGFKSTTDTCVALQSLAKYSEQTAGAKLDLKITIKPSSQGSNNPRSININNQNALLQQSVDIYPYLRQEPVDFVIETSGTGVAQMQFKVKYNLPMTKEEKCAFSINSTLTNVDSGASFTMNDAPAGRANRPSKLSAAEIEQRRKAERRCKRKKPKRKRRRCLKRLERKYNKKNNNKPDKKKKPKTEAPRELVINVCTRYKKPGKTGMAIVDVGILTGYRADEVSLKKLMKKMNDTIANYENSERSVVFYLDSIDSAKEVCIGVKLERFVAMGAVYPMPIKVYDYYEPDVSCTKYYGLGKGATEIGSCNGDKCICTQDKCAALNPSIQDHDKLVLKICNEYSFAIVATVIHVDEENSWLTYHVKVQEVIKNGNKNIMKGEIIQFWKRGSCLSPNLSKGQLYLIMGRDKAGKYIIDNSAFVADVERGSLSAVAQRIQNGECD